jgi:dTDP-4-amino-4,6-dideoxygalactose transaminase
MEPFHDVRAQYLAHRAEIDAALRAVLESGSYILGATLERFERAFGEYLGAPHVVGVASGTAALELALRALGIGPGDEVAIPALTAVPTAMAVWSVGAAIRVVDVDLATCTLDPDALERELTPAVKAIVPVHLYGGMADMEAIAAIADRRGIPLVEDAAQAHGSRTGARKAGTLGRIGCFSFYPTKNLGSYGDAGAVATADPELAARVARLRSYGGSGGYRYEEPGVNARMDDLHAAILLAKLPHLEAWNERRRAHAALYRARLAGGPVALPVERVGSRHVYHQFVVRSPRRDELRAHLASAGIATLVHYPEAVHQLEALRGCVRFRARPLRAEQAAATVLSLPIYPELPEAQLERSIDAVLAFAPRARGPEGGGGTA